MRARLLPVLLAAALLPGCGGEHSPPDTPVGAVEGFVAAVGHGDWTAACERVGTSGSGQLTRELPLARGELDDQGEIRDCPATLERHADGVRRLVAGAKPDRVLLSDSDHAIVSSPRGDWIVDHEVVDDTDERWQVADFPGR